TGRFVRDIEPALGVEFLDVAIARREAQIQPDRMLDDHRRKAVAAMSDFGDRDRLLSASLPGLSGYPDKPRGISGMPQFFGKPAPSRFDAIFHQLSPSTTNPWPTPVRRTGRLLHIRRFIASK